MKVSFLPPLALIFLFPTAAHAQKVAQPNRLTGSVTLNENRKIDKTRQNAYALGIQLYSSKRYKDAVSSFWQSVSAENGGASAWLYLAHSCLAAGDQTTAIRYYQRVVTLYPQTPQGVQARQYLNKLAPESLKKEKGEEEGEEETSSSPSQATPVKIPAIESRITTVRPVVGHPEVDTFLVKEIKSCVEKIPPSIKVYLNKAQIKFVLTPTMIDKYPAGAYQEVAGYEGGTKKSCPGLFDPRAREIVLAEHTVSENTDEVQRAKPLDEIKGTFLHECGHALDFSARRISLTDDYRFAYYKDIAQIPDEVAGKIRYYLQKSDRGQIESCGELLGILMGNKRRNSDLMIQYFPNTLSLLRKKFDLH